jgi:MFS family permease
MSAGRTNVLRVLRHREFAFFWAGQAGSLIGTWMQAFAQGLVVVTLTTSPFALGLVNFAASIPTLLLMPFGGVAADRYERRAILIYTQWLMLLLAALTGWLVAAGQLTLGHLYVIAFFLGIATAYELPAYQSFFPQLVDREDLRPAIALNQATFHASRIVGPALAAWIVAAWGTASAFYANAASFLAGRASVLRQMREGIEYVRERPVVQALLTLTGVTTFFIFPNLAVLMPYYALHVLRVGAPGLGTLMSVSGIGSMIGAFLLLSVPEERRLAAIGTAAVGLLASMSVLAWSHALWLSVIAQAFLSLSISFSVGLASIMVQEMVPDELRGRVMSLYTLMFTGIMPFGALAIPAIVERVGMRAELQGAAVLYAVGVGLLMLRLVRSRTAA